jgi:hypothetical protein
MSRTGASRLSGAAALAAALTTGNLWAWAQVPEPRPETAAEVEGVVVRTRPGGGFQRGGGGGGGDRFRNFDEVTQGAEKTDGLFALYKTGDHLYAELRPHDLNQPLLVPVTIARGMARAGMPVGDDDMVLVFRRVGDRIQLVRRNIHYKAPAGSPLEKAVGQNYTDSVLMALPIISMNPAHGGAVLIDFSDIFLTDFAQLGLGPVDRSRSSWHKVKGFHTNLELEVETTFGGGGGGRGGRAGGGQHNDGVADHRGITVVLHYSLMKTPDHGYRTRHADDRVGHFLSANKDFGLSDPDTNFVRQVNRWRLEKAEPHAEMSPPKRQIIWYVEDTVPIEYRPYVEDGIREWNKAFEKIGFRDAIAVRWQQAGRDEFDPEDTNYCTFRWITPDHDGAFAMSCLRANPLTGEMIDGDVVFDAGWVRYWKQQYALLIGAKSAAGGVDAPPSALAVGELISPILASRMGFGQPAGHGLLGADALGLDAGRMTAEVVPADQSPLHWQLARASAAGARGLCQFQSGFQQDFALAAIALADTRRGEKADDAKDKDKDKEKGRGPRRSEKEKAKDELPREFVGQAIKHIVMHEVGHSLGLRHNFKASTMLTAEQLNDTSVTRVKGLVGSVMDYSPINLAPKGQKQGDYYSTTIGPYDYWAIEYAYKSIDGDEQAELKKIASRAPEHDLAYATDEDVVLNDDPYVNRHDLGADPCRFGRDRIALATDLMKDLDARVVKGGDSWSRNRRAFSVLLQQWGDGATLASHYVGGQTVSRDHKDDKGARDPIVPISGAKQRECLKFLADQILSDKSFQFSPTLLRRLGSERWMHWGSDSFSGPSVNISVLERILGIQKIVLSHCLGGSTLARLENQQLQADNGSDPLRMEEVFRALTDGIWSDLDQAAPAAGAGAPKDAKFMLSTVRRNLQREYLKRLTGLVLGSGGAAATDRFTYVVFVRGGNDSVPADARALARLHLDEIATRTGKALDARGKDMDDTTRAHLKECQHRIAKVLEANLDIKEQ